MYRALYRKWRPQKFADVVGQPNIVAALQNQILTGHVGHAYLFTGTRGTGKTTCAKIFAKAVNCQDSSGADPCGVCPVCRGIEDGSVLDVEEIDAASNNGVDYIRDLRDDAAYIPTSGKYKVFIVDEVHMLSMQAFNALLKILEEPPAHVIFILATTEIHKVPATIRSRCQRYDFGRILPADIAGRVDYIAGQEGISLTPAATELISRLADGALRDALSILDTCAGVSQSIDEDLVRRMAGVTDRSYLFRVSDALAAQDVTAALTEVAQLRQNSVDMKRLCEELTEHYRNLMLAALPGSEGLLTGISPDEETAYREKAPTLARGEAIRAIRILGEALGRMARGDQRIELELALFGIAQPTPVAQAAQPTARPQAFAGAAPAPAAFVSRTGNGPPMPPTPPAAPPPHLGADAPAEPPQNADRPLDASAVPTPADLAPEPVLASAQPAAQPAPKPQQPTGKPEPFPAWAEVLGKLEQQDAMVKSFFHGSKAYYDGRHVLIDCNEMARELLRKNKETKARIKQTIKDCTGVSCGIGPYTAEEEATGEAASGVSTQEIAKNFQAAGVEFVLHENE